MATGEQWIENEGGLAWQNTSGSIEFVIKGASFGSSSSFKVNGTEITVNDEAAFSASTIISLDNEGAAGGYTFKLADGLATAASISTASLSFTGSTTTQTLKGDLEAYYTLTPLEVTYTAAQSNVNLATITGLSAGASLAMDTDKKTIKLDAPDLTSTAVNLSIENIAAATNYGFKLGLFDSSSESSSLGFKAGDNIWTVSSDNKSAIYQNTTKEGWTISEDGMGVSYAAEAHKDIVSISGFKGNIFTLSANEAGNGQPAGVYYRNSSNNYVYAVSAAVGGSTFTVYHDALATDTANTLTLTKGDGASAGWDYKLAFDAAEQTKYGKSGGSSTLGLSAQDPYWTVTGGTATYQFNTTEGWTLDENYQTIAYSKAHSTGGAANAFEAPTPLASISGLNSSISKFENNVVSVSGTTDTAKTITILKDSIFDTTTDGKTAHFTDAPGDDVVYSLALSSAILQKPQVVGNVAPTLSNGSNGTSYVKATLEAYYSISGTSDATVTYHAQDKNANIATITGLAGNAALTFFDSDKGAGGASIILLDSNDLGAKDVTLTQAGYSNAQTYSLSLAATGTDSVLTTENKIDNNVTATLGLSSSDNTKYEVSGTTLKYYTLSGNSSVQYHAPEKKVIATISGLSTNGVVLGGGNANVSVDSKDHRTIYLPEEALGTDNIELTNQSVGGTRSHGLKLQLVSASGASVSHIGIEDSGAYWNVTSHSATYQHYTTAGWSSVTNIKINRVDKTDPEAYFYIKGLSTSVQYTSTGEEPEALEGVAINNKVVTIDTSILDKTASTTKEAKGTGYTFNLKAIDADDGNKVGFGNEDGNKKYWTVTNANDGTYTLNYKYDIAEGWEIDKDGKITYTALNTKDLAQITGLTGLGKINDSSKHYTDEEVGIEVTGRGSYTFKLSTSLLGQSAINLTSQSGASSTDTFELAIAGSKMLDDKTVYGFNDSGLYWSVQSGGTSATYQHDISEGWTLSGKSNITHTSASSNVVVATVTGLKNGVRKEDLEILSVSEPGSASSPGTITLTKTVIDAAPDSNGYMISLNDADNYKLALASDIATIGGSSHTIGLDFTGAAGGSAIVRESLAGGWLGASTGKSFDYHKAVDETLATITGLSVGGVSAGNVFLGTGGTSTTIYLKQGALTTANVSLSSTKYSLSLADANGTADADGKFGFETLDNAWGVNGSSALYYEHTREGWELQPGGKSVVYTSEEKTRNNLVVIANLAEGLSAVNDSISGITIKGKTVTLNQEVLSHSESTPVNIALGDGYTLKLNGADSKGKLGFNPSGMYWKVDGQSAYYNKDTSEGWTLASNSISYSGLSTQTFATITGLSGVTAGTSTSIAGVSLKSDDITFELGAAVLGTSTITINGTNSKGKEYALGFAGTTGKDDAGNVTFGFSAMTPAFSYSGTSATLLQDKAEGWTLAGKSISYTVATAASAMDNVKPVTLAVVSGLSEAGMSGGNVFYGQSTDSLTVYLKEAALLVGTSATLKGAGYTLKLANADGTADADGKFGFEDSGLYWSVSGTSAYYQHDTAAGWTLKDNVVNYSASNADNGGKAQVTVTLSGLSNLENYSESGAIRGISIEEKTFTHGTTSSKGGVISINDEDLFGLGISDSAKSISLELGNGIYTGDYTLALGASLATHTVAAYDKEATMSLSNFSSGKVSILGGLTDYFEVSDNSTTLTHHSKKENQVLATITGLSTNASASNVTLESTTITLGKDALTNGNVSAVTVSISGVPEYTFDLDDDVLTTENTLDDTAGLFEVTIKDGTATITGKTKAYYKDNDSNIAYYGASTVTLGTITGISTAATKSDFKFTSDGNGGLSIGLSNAVLAEGSGITLTTVDSIAGANGFKLYFTEDNGATNDQTANDGAIGFVHGSLSWVHSGTQAIHRYDVGKGWTLADDGKSISYTGAKTGDNGTVLAKVTGLNGAYNNDTFVSLSNLSSANDYTITLGESALAARDVNLITTDAAGVYKYSLQLEGGTSIGLDLNTSYAKWVIEDGIASYQADKAAGWVRASDNLITYTPTEKGAQVLAQIEGLKSGLKVNSEGQIAGISVDSGKITLSNSVLGTDKVTLTDKNPNDSVNYELGLGGDVAQDDGSVTYWTSKGTTGTYKKDTQAYYSLSGTSGVDYHEATSKTLATLTNLPKGTTAASTGADRPATIDGIIVLPNSTGNGGTIKVGSDALSTDAKKFITLTNGEGSTYSLKLDDDVATTLPSYVWSYGTTTKLLKATTPATYSDSDGKEIKYTAATMDNKTGTIFELGGVKKTVSEDDVIFYDDLDPTTQVYWKAMVGSISLAGASTVADLTNAVIVKDTALDNKNVTLTTKQSGETKYKLLFFDTDLTDNISTSAPVVSDAGFTLSKTSAIYKGNITQGYTSSTDKKTGKVTAKYSAAKDGATLFTISGLPKDITQAQIDEGINVSDTTNSDGNYEVTVSADILKRVTGKLTIKGTGYVFKLLTSTTDGTYLTADDDRVTKGVDVWRVSGTTATYKQIKPAHYALDAKQTSISYVKEATFKSDKVDQIYAQIGGLPKGLIVEDDFSTGATTTSRIGKTVDGTFTEYITVAGTTSKTYNLAEAAYENATKIEFTPKIGTNALSSETLAALAAPSAITANHGVWSVSGTTATLKTAGTSEGWEKKETTTKTTYTRKAAAASGSEILKISGLQKGLTVKADGTINGIDNSNISIDASGKVSGNVAVSSPAVYGTSNVTFKLGKNMDGVTYTAEDVSAQTGQEIWTLSGTTLTIQKGTTASYTYDGKGTVTYKKANPTSTLVKITGLAKGLTLDQVQAGITVTGKTITFKNASLLGTSDITATNSYSIVLDGTIKPSLMVEYTPTWSYSGEKATLKAASSGGFATTTTTKNGKTTLKYNKASAGNVLLTIDKLQKGLSVTAVDDDSNGFANQIDGIDDSGLRFSTDKSTITNGTIKVSDVALNSKTVTLKNASTTLSKATLTYDDDDGTNKSTTTHTIWEISGTTGKLYNAEEEGYRDASTSNNTVINYYNGKTKTSTTPLATVKGLKKSLKPDSNGQVEGIEITDGIDSDAGKTIITLDSRALGTTNVSVSGTNYKLKLDATGDYKVVDTSSTTTTYKCTVKGTTVTIREFTPASYKLDGSVIKYTGAKQGNIVATLSGVAGGLKAGADGSIEGINIEEASGKVKVTLGKAALGTTDVTVKAADGKFVNLAVDDGDSAAPTTTWQTTSDGNVILTTTYKQGYELAADAQSISYTDSGSVKTVISGFTGLSDGTAQPSFITLNSDTKTITVTDINKVRTNGVAIAGGDYSLALDNDTSSTAWEMNGTTATLYKTLTANSYTCDGVKISKVTADRTQILATITGLPEGMTADDFDISKNKDADGNTIITLNNTNSLLDNATNIKLTGNGYKLAFQNEEEIKPHETDKGVPVWSMKGTTATYAEGTTAGYTLSADGKTATYSAFALGKGKSAVATIKGLNSNYKPSDLTTNIGSEKTVTLKADMLGTTDLELSGTGYKFDKGNIELDSPEIKWTAATAGTTQGWAFSKGTATYQDITGAYYSAGATKITYNAAKASTSARATITGLNKNLKAVDGEIDGIEVGGDYITLSNSVLASGNVTITGKNSDTNNDYKLNLADDVPEPESTEPELSLNKTTAYLKNSTSAGYTVNDDGKGVTFHKAANNVTLATIEGLNKGIVANEDGSIDGVTFNGDKTITISDEALPTAAGATVKLTDNSKSGYTLALDSTESEDNVYDTDVWSFSNGTATFKSVKPAHYKLDEKANTITHVKEADLDGYATVTGLASFDESENFGGDSTGGIITLKSTNLSTSKVVSVQGSGFTLSLEDDSMESTVDSTSIAWSNSTSNNVTTAKLTGKVTAGYLLENDNTKISYQNGAGTKTFAAIAGISSGQELETYIVDTTNKVVELGSDQLTNAVTVSSGFEFSISFDDDYDNASIAGTAGAENVVIAGSNVSVSLGGGDDHVTFDGSKNVFYYGAGDGNDVITKFNKADDTIRITKGSITSAEVKGDDNDVILTVKEGSTTSTITLKESSFNANDVLNYTNSKGNPASIKVKAASADLLYDEESNFVTAGSQLDEITPVTPAAQSLNEDFTSPQNFKLLARQNSLLAYLNSKNK